MNKVYRVNLGARSYDIHIEPGCLDDFGRVAAKLLPDARRCLIVSNDVVAPLYLKRLQNSLQQAGWQVTAHILPDGERYKNVENWNAILDSLMRARLTRQEPVIALGGGVVGDMAGFAAACYRRGVPLIQVPTTLLAQVDSSVGGKTAVNHPLGKNMIGAFYQPRLVWIDPDVLVTLPEREFRAGLAEVIKYGLIRDAGFFFWLEDHMSELLGLDTQALTHVIHESCRHKSEVVMRDELEQGERALLNLGHTFGHAIEAMTRYRKYLHGESVAMGTLMASRLSEQLGYAPAGTEQRIHDLYRSTGLPVDVPGFRTDEWLEAMGHDKKSGAGGIRYVLLHGIGDAFLAEDVSDDEVRRLIASYHQ
ncbi:MAG: 3-dehydroquinate synthase [Mariprofundaceae bacterium]|nr:3-dehydroquinate synthase [Mariprofundaceae bacterium]